MPSPDDNYSLPSWVVDEKELEPYRLSQIGSQSAEDTAIQFWSLNGCEILCRIFDHNDDHVVNAQKTVVEHRGAMKLKAAYVRTTLPQKSNEPKKRIQREKRFKAECIHGHVLFGEGLLVIRPEHHSQEFINEFRVNPDPPRRFSAKAQVRLQPWESANHLHPASFWVRSKDSGNDRTSDNPARRGEPPMNNINIGTAGSVSIGNHGPTTQTANVNVNELEQFIQRLRTSLNDEALSDNQRSGISRNINIIEGELGKPEPDKVLIRQAGSSLRTVLEGAAGDVVGAVLTQSVDWVAILHKARALFG